MLLGERVGIRHFDLDRAVIDIGQFGPNCPHDVLARETLSHALTEPGAWRLIHMLRSSHLAEPISALRRCESANGAQKPQV